jgi:hypothetical protein
MTNFITFLAVGVQNGSIFYYFFLPWTDKDKAFLEQRKRKTLGQKTWDLYTIRNVYCKKKKNGERKKSK